MNNYDNYIFLAICEVSVKNFKNSTWQTYKNYCVNFSKSLNNNELSKKDKYDLVLISKELELLFSLSADERFDYIVRFFNSGKYNEFETIIRETKKLFPFTGA